MYCCDKNSATSKEVEMLEVVLKVLAEKNRLRIVCLLSKGELCVCNIGENLNLAQNLISHHLSILRKNNIIIARKEKNWVHYSLNKKLMKNIITTLQQITL